MHNFFPRRRRASAVKNASGSTSQAQPSRRSPVPAPVSSAAPPALPPLPELLQESSTTAKPHLGSAFSLPHTRESTLIPLSESISRAFSRLRRGSQSSTDVRSSMPDRTTASIASTGSRRSSSQASGRDVADSDQDSASVSSLQQDSMGFRHPPAGSHQRIRSKRGLHVPEPLLLSDPTSTNSNGQPADKQAAPLPPRNEPSTNVDSAMLMMRGASMPPASLVTLPPVVAEVRADVARASVRYSHSGYDDVAALYDFYDQINSGPSSRAVSIVESLHTVPHIPSADVPSVHERLPLSATIETPITAIPPSYSAAETPITAVPILSTLVETPTTAVSEFSSPMMSELPESDDADNTLVETDFSMEVLNMRRSRSATMPEINERYRMLQSAATKGPLDAPYPDKVSLQSGLGGAPSLRRPPPPNMPPPLSLPPRPPSTLVSPTLPEMTVNRARSASNLCITDDMMQQLMTLASDADAKLRTAQRTGQQHPIVVNRSQSVADLRATQWRTSNASSRSSGSSQWSYIRAAGVGGHCDASPIYPPSASSAGFSSSPIVSTYLPLDTVTEGEPTFSAHPTGASPHLEPMGLPLHMRRTRSESMNSYMSQESEHDAPAVAEVPRSRGNSAVGHGRQLSGGGGSTGERVGYPIYTRSRSSSNASNLQSIASTTPLPIPTIAAPIAPPEDAENNGNEEGLSMGDVSLNDLELPDMTRLRTDSCASGRSRIRDSVAAFLGIEPDPVPKVELEEFDEGPSVQYGDEDEFDEPVPVAVPANPPSTTSLPDPTAAEDSDGNSNEDEFGLEYDEREEEANQRRTATMRELVLTERTYVKGLRLVNRMYVTPLRTMIDPNTMTGTQAQLYEQQRGVTSDAHSSMSNTSQSSGGANSNRNWVNTVMNGLPVVKGLTSRDVDRLFANLESIMVMHEELLQDLEQRFANWDAVEPVSDIFQHRIYHFRQYFLYLRNYPQAMSLLDRLTKQSVGFRRFLAQSNNGREDNSKMIAYLTMPTSRITRYFEFLETMCGNMSPFHPDYHNLLFCTEEMGAIADEATRLLRAMEGKRLVLDVQISLHGFADSLITEHRRLVCTGELIMVHLVTYAHEPRLFFLFNDLLIWAKVNSKGERQYRGKYDLTQSELFDLVDTRNYSNAIQFVSGTEMVIIGTRSPEDKQRWFGVFRQVLRDLQRAKQGLPPKRRGVNRNRPHSASRSPTSSGNSCSGESNPSTSRNRDTVYSSSSDGRSSLVVPDSAIMSSGSVSSSSNHEHSRPSAMLSPPMPATSAVRPPVSMPASFAKSPPIASTPLSSSWAAPSHLSSPDGRMMMAGGGGGAAMSQPPVARAYPTVPLAPGMARQPSPRPLPPNYRSHAPSPTAMPHTASYSSSSSATQSAGPAPITPPKKKKEKKDKKDKKDKKKKSQKLMAHDPMRYFSDLGEVGLASLSIS